jgi:NAD(P)-dependent dehydrogenase (short-subunit alcohol dehydrogenase family)
MKKLEGKVAVITGGSSGIGLATAKRFVEEGAQVVITGRREKELKDAAALIKENVTTVVGDVSRLEDLDRLYAVVKEKHGHIDILFANAGAGTIAPLAVATEAHFDQTFDVNVKGMFFTVQKALPLFKDGGSIILNSSVSNVLGLPGFTAYAASKAAVRNFARGWALELKDRKIRVNCMSPGAIDTPALATTTGLTAEQAEQAVAQFTTQIPWVAEACPRKSPQQSRSSPPMKVLTSPAWISPSMEAWRRSDLGINTTSEKNDELRNYRLRQDRPSDTCMLRQRSKIRVFLTMSPSCLEGVNPFNVPNIHTDDGIYHPADRMDMRTMRLLTHSEFGPHRAILGFRG